MRYILSCFLLLGTALPAQRVLEWWHLGWEEAFEEARRRNVPVLVAFIQDGEEADECIVAGLYKDPAFIKLTQSTVPIMASMQIHKPRKQEIRGTTISACGRYGSVTCGMHKEHEMMARGLLWPGGAVKTPAHVLLLPDTKEVGRLIDVHPTGSYENLVGRARRKMGRGLSVRQYREASRHLAEARAALEQGEVASAQKALQALEKVAAGTPLQDQGDRLALRIVEMGTELLERAKDLVRNGEHLQALSLLAEAQQAYGQTPLNKEIKKVASGIRRTPAGRAAGRLLDRQKRALPAFERARAAEEKRDYARAAGAYYQVLSLASGTPLADRARARIDAFQKDEDIARLIAPVVAAREADLVCREGSRLLRAGKREEGRARLEEVLRRWPESRAAKRARKLLGKQE